MVHRMTGPSPLRLARLYTQRPRSRDSPTLNREADVGFVESVDDLPLGLHPRETTSTARYQSNSHECPRQACYRR